MSPDLAFHGAVEAAGTDLPNGYSLVLPPAWVRIPLRRGTEQAVLELADRACKQLPGDFPRDKVTPYRMELLRRLRKGAKEAQSGSGLDLYLPGAGSGASIVAASFIVAEMRMNGGGEVDPVEVLARLVGEGDRTGPFEVAVVDGSVGVRREAIAGGGAAVEAELPSRRVDYIVPVPEDPDRWLAVSFSTLGGGDPSDELADVLVELFDAVVTTFRWSRT
ncbi:hypothetical protein [Streptomyces sp. H39-S7]|uniref:hypothetical protein n=1 Tax=Streptomyces sp. H39-S7 TaxID=3004357 RepID=UPI0022AF4460|nr:hypothetical protein [Streptomyces sp. H39-S7]MCZ4118593.1 hypothetical protein [Streptomyces sp. H39-S7]